MTAATCCDRAAGLVAGPAIPSLTDDRMEIRRVIGAAHERAGGDMREALLARDLP